MLSGEFVKELPALLHLMDGRTSLQKITAGIPETAHAEFEQFILLLSNKGMLSDGPASASSHDLNGAHTHQNAYWSLHASSAEEAAIRLNRANVVVVDLGGVGLTVTLALAAAGVRITGIDHRTVRACDQGVGYEAQDVGKLRVSAVERHLNTENCKSFIPLSENIQRLSNWDEIVSKADLVVLCSDGMSLAAYDRTNETCLRQKTRWVSARIDRHRGLIGPFVVPEQTACFTCFELRSRANSEHPTDHAAIYRHWKNNVDTPDDWPIISPFAGIVGNYLALDIQRVLVDNQVSLFLGRTFHVDFHTLESRFHDILKLPRCPVCSRERGRPLTRIWDIRTAESSVCSD
jgi:bacteriocin biosynthesis cyclodehydratase domain-containing protein